MSQTISKPRITAPKPFDVALGESLAQLTSGEPAVEEPNVEGTTAPGKRPTGHHVEPPRTVALHPVVPSRISAARPAAAESKVDSIQTEQIPRSYSARTVWVVVALIVVVAGASVGVSLAHRAPSLETILPPVTVTPPEARPGMTTTTTPPLPLPQLVPPAHREELHIAVLHAIRPKVAASEAARLWVDSDVPANVYVDGEFVQVTPLVGLELSPGRHVVRAESSASGLRLIPREETLMLRPAESRHLNLDLK